MALHQANYSKLQGTLKQTRDETMKTFLLNWLDMRIQPSVSERTYQGYHDLITKHLLPTLGHIKVHKLTVEHIQKLYELKRHENSAPQTIRNIALLLRRALDEACQRQDLFQNVCRTMTLPKVPRALSVCSLTIEQAKHFLTVVKGDPLEALSVLALTTGMRQGELLSHISMTLDIYSHVLPTLQENAMAHLNTLLAAQDLSLRS